MELTVRVLCSPEVAAGFELAGVLVEQADDTTAGDAMRRLAANPATGIVLVEERLRRALPDDLMAHLNRQPTPSWSPSPRRRGAGRG